MVRFHRHPGDGLCIACTQWLRECARAITRRNNPLWKIAARIRSRKARSGQPAA
jgi:hypothetical protein